MRHWPGANVPCFIVHSQRAHRNAASASSRDLELELTRSG